MHTHQTEAENSIHAAVEWTVNRTYASVRALGLQQNIPAPDAAPSIEALLRHGAARATTHYETILAHYDIKRGVVAPEEGLDLVGQRAMGEMLVHASRLIAAVLDRAVMEAAVSPPEVALASEAAKAFFMLPASKRKRMRLDATDRAQIEAMYDELMATGHVEKTLPEDERKIRDLFASEVLKKTAPNTSWSNDETPVPAVIGLQIFTAAVPNPLEIAAVDQPPTASSPATSRPSPARPISRQPLARDADIVDAPSIGPKTARKLKSVDIRTVGDFLNAHPVTLAASLGDDGLSPLDLTEWQDQTRLMCALGELRAVDAKLLVGAGYRTIKSVASVTPDQLCADITSYAVTKDGKVHLRDGKLQVPEKMRSWVSAAQAA